MRPSPELADFQGEIETFGSVGTAYLFADENRLYLRAPFVRYQFTPSEIVALEESGERGVTVKHTRPDYPEKIVFNSSDNRAAEMLLAIANKNFIPCAAADDIPTREGYPIRDELFIGMYVMVNILLFLALIVGIVFAILSIDYPPVEFGSWRGAILWSAIVTAFVFIRFCRPIHWVLIKPGRYMSELSAGLDNWILCLSIFPITNFLVYLGIPEIFAVGIGFLFLWAIVQIDLKLMP